jgi:hypothetical protein
LPRTLRHHVAHLPWTSRTVRDVRRPRKLRDVIADLSTGRRRCAASWSLSVKRCRVGLAPLSTESDQAEGRTDGRVRARLAAPAPLMIAQQLAGRGAVVEVLEPASVRSELARLGSGLVERYGN